MKASTVQVVSGCVWLGMASWSPAQTAYGIRQYRSGDFRLVSGGVAADVLVAANDHRLTQIVLDPGGMRPSYLGPPETRTAR